jgi:hypothetical protein
MVAAAVIGAGVVGAGASVYSSDKAASAQTHAANEAAAQNQNFFNIDQANAQPFIQAGESAQAQLPGAEANYQPYINAGTNASNKITGLEGGNGVGGNGVALSTLESLPGYQFANIQGLKSTQNSATERGLGLSGAALKGAASYSTGLANTYYNNLLSGLQNTASTGLSATSGLSGTIQNQIGTGANAAAGLGTNAVQTGSNIGNNLIGAGNAQAGASIATGNAIGSAASSVPGGIIAGQLLQNFNNQNGNNSYLNSNGLTDSENDPYLVP